MKEQHKMLAAAPVGPLLLKMAIPTITANLIHVLYNMIDRMFIGHIPEVGPDALTGVGVCLPLTVIIMAFAALAGAGGAPRASIMMGRGKSGYAQKILGNCASAIVIMGVLLMAVQWLFGKDLLYLFGASDSTIGYAWDYLKIYAAGTVFVLISTGLNPFITAQGFTKISMISVIIGAVTNILLDAVFIIVFNMGVTGAALATIIAQALSSAWIIRFLRSEKTALRLQKKNLRIEKKVYLPCAALGLSPFVMQSTEGLITICFNTSLLQYGGDIAVGAMTILASVMQLSMLPLTGITQGAQPIISFNYGAGNIDRVRKTFFLTLRACLIFGTVIWAISMFLPQIFIGIFTSDATLTEYTISAIHIYMATAFLLGIQVSCQQTFLALGKAKISLFLAALRKIFLLIPLIYIVPHFTEAKDVGVFLAEPIADTLAVIATASCFIYVFRKIISNHDNSIK